MLPVSSRKVAGMLYTVTAGLRKLSASYKQVIPNSVGGQTFRLVVHMHAVMRPTQNFSLTLFTQLYRRQSIPFRTLSSRDWQRSHAM